MDIHLYEDEIIIISPIKHLINKIYPGVKFKDCFIDTFYLKEATPVFVISFIDNGKKIKAVISENMMPENYHISKLKKRKLNV